MEDCMTPEKEAFDLSKVKINEKAYGQHSIIDSSIYFDRDKNHRYLLLKISKRLNSIGDELLRDFNKASFTFNIENFSFEVKIAFAVSQDVNPIIHGENYIAVKLLINKIVRINICDNLFSFKLFNLSNKILKEYITLPGGGFQFSKLSISVAQHDWILSDAYFLQKRSSTETYLNGVLTLSTAESYTEARKQMNYICHMLSFITRKHVCCFESYDNNGILVETFNETAEPYGNEPEIIDLFSKTSPSELIKGAYSEYQKDPDWWNITIEYVTEIRAAKALQSKMILSCVQLERISNKFISHPSSIMDESLTGKKKEIVNILTSSLSGILPNWNSEYSDKLFNTMKRWNSEYSLTEKIKILAKQYNTPKLFKNLPKYRGSLAHNGVFNDNDSIEELFYSLKELALFVIIIILRIFKYNGDFTHEYIKGDSFRSLDIDELDSNKNLAEFNSLKKVNSEKII